jgi:hypothetical protein
MAKYFNIFLLFLCTFPLSSLQVSEPPLGLLHLPPGNDRESRIRRVHWLLHTVQTMEPQDEIRRILIRNLTEEVYTLLFRNPRQQQQEQQQ